MDEISCFMSIIVKKLGRIGSSHFSIYPYGPFKCGDNKVVMIGIQNEREWAQFCKYS